MKALIFIAIVLTVSTSNVVLSRDIDDSEHYVGSYKSDYTRGNTAPKLDLPKVENDRFHINSGALDGERNTPEGGIRRHGKTPLLKENTTRQQQHRYRLPPDVKVRLRRKRRNTKHSRAERGDGRKRVREQTSSCECEEKPFWITASFYFAIVGWGLLAVVFAALINVKYKVCKSYREFKQWRRERKQKKDIEAQQDSELTIYERQGRRPTGRGFVRFNDDCIEMIDESYGFEGVSEAAPTRNVSMLSHRDVQHNRHLAERRKIIKKVTLQDNLNKGIEYAQSVIVGASDRERFDRRSSEKRAIIKEHTSDTRRPSLIEEIQFAKNIILEEGDGSLARQEDGQES